MKETFHLTETGVTLDVVIVYGKQDEIFVTYCPSLNVSGYGESQKDAEDSFNHNVEVFCEDFAIMTVDEKNKLLFQLGWEQEAITNKNFSHASIDINGNLQNFDFEVRTFEEKRMILC